LGFLGTSGSGKTYNAGAAVERLLQQKAKVVIIDPLSVWWGLRLTADGKHPSPYNVAIFGGSRGDLPLDEYAGALIGETAATMAESCIVDLCELGSKSSERRFMTAFLETIYRKAGGEPFHLVVDEADLFAPQKPHGGDETLLGLMENIVRRGRVKGFVPWLISQRPAVVNKNVLSQMDGLIAFKLTSSQDRDALDAWIEGQADKAQGKAIKDSLPAMQVGEGVVWLPTHGVLETVQFPRKATFDSSRAPKRGERAKKAKALKPINLGDLKERLATVEAEAKANDPRALRAQVAERDREIAKLTYKSTAKAPPDKDAIAAAEKRGFEQAEKKLKGVMERELRKNLKSVLGTLRGYARKFMEQIDGELEAVNIRDAKAEPVTFTPAAPAPTMVPRAAPSVPPRVPSGAKSATPSDDGDRPLGAERKPLAALASVYPAGMTEGQWRVAAGFKNSGTWSTYRGRLSDAGRIERRGDLWFVTEKGLADLGDSVPTMPPPGRALVEFWVSKISGVGPMLRRLAEIYPQWTTREQLAADVGLVHTSGTYSTYLGRLRSPGLIEVTRDKQLRASPMLMEGREAA
jgi:hypothetical protein